MFGQNFLEAPLPIFFFKERQKFVINVSSLGLEEA